MGLFLQTNLQDGLLESYCFMQAHKQLKKKGNVYICSTDCQNVHENVVESAMTSKSDTLLPADISYLEISFCFHFRDCQQLSM